MDFTLSKKHEMARQLFKEFAENEVKPLAQEVDETEHFPEETVAKMQKLGFMGIPVPKEYGGQGCDPLTYIMCVEELSKVCGTTGVIVSAHTSLCADPILTYGTEEQKQKYLVPLAKGEKLGAFGLTEPGAGTDAQGVQTKHLEETGAKVVIGQKAENITDDIDLVVYTAAIHESNEEFAATKNKGIPMMTRAALLGQIMANFAKSIAVAGTHGKTTTTSMLTHILLQADTDPTVSVGGMLDRIGGNIRVGMD